MSDDGDEGDEESEGQDDYSCQSNDHFDNSNPNPHYLAEKRDEHLEQEAENVNSEDEHKNVTPEATNKPPNPSNDRNFDKDPDFNKNPVSSTEDDPFVMQPESGYRSGPNSSGTKAGNGYNDNGNKKGAHNTYFNASYHSGSHGGQRGPQNPPGGHKQSWFQAKQIYGSWITKKIPYRHPNHTFDCIPAALADDLGLVRLALVFSVGLGEIVNWKIEDRILKWSENLIKVFGLGLRWEYFKGYAHGAPLPYPDHGSRHDGISEGKKRWQVIAGRLFFKDLLSLVTHDSLTETGKKWYCDMARMLLASIWARLGNRSDNFDTSG